MTKSGKHCGKRRNCSFCHYVFKKPSAAEASERVYMKERVKRTYSCQVLLRVNISCITVISLHYLYTELIEKVKATNVQTLIKTSPANMTVETEDIITKEPEDNLGKCIPFWKTEPLTIV